MTNLNIRRALPSDVEKLHKLIVDLAVYEKEPDAVVASESDIHQALFCDSPRAFSLICEQEQPGESEALTVGFAIYFYNFSTWLGKHGIYLEDLYVMPEARGQGAGKALLKAVAQIARDEHLGRFEWSVLKWNTPAIEFYESVGAAALDEWVGYRMDRAAIEAFCANDA